MSPFHLMGKLCAGIGLSRRLVLLLIMILSAIPDNRAQYISKDNYTGSWYDADSWVGNASPGMSIDGEDIYCYGWLTAENCLDYNNGQLRIYDTLVVYGTFALFNKARLFIEPGGILIVFGDYISNNKVEVENKGYLIVTGEFQMLGSDNQGFFHNTKGKVFIFDDDPEIKGVPNYSDLACDDTSGYPVTCGYGNELDLLNDPIYEFYASFNYDPTNIPVTCVIVSFEADREEVCQFDTVVFTNLSTGVPNNVQYNWDFGEGAVPGKITGEGPHKVVYKTSGPKNVELSAYSETGSTLYSKLKEEYILVGEIPEVIIEDASRCGAGEVVLNAYTDNGDMVQFSTDGGISIAYEAISAPFEFPVYLEEGQEILVWAQAIDTAIGCMSGWNHIAMVNAYPFPDVSIEDTSRCGTGEVILNANTDNGDMVQFSTDGGNSIAYEAISAPFEFPVYLEEGQEILVWAQAIDTISGCMSGWDQTASAYAYLLPDVMFEDTSRCGTGEVILNAYTDNGDIIQFSTDGGNSIASEAISAPFEFPVYLEEGQEILVWAQAIDTASSCMSGWDHIAMVNAYPFPDVSIEDTSRCGTGEMILNANTGNGDMVQFSTDAGISILNEDYSAPYTCPVFLEEWHRVIVWARAINTTSGCMSGWDQSATAYAYPLPDATIVGDSILCNGEELFFTVEDHNFIERYLWHDGSTLYYYTTDREEVVYVTVWNNLGCQDSDTIVIERCEMEDLVSTTVYSFSPNADGLNDYWFLGDIENYPEAKIWIYDRQGKIVFHSPGGYQNDWDGTYNGKVLPVDSYYFVIDLNKYNRGIVTGLVTLVYLN